MSISKIQTGNSYFQGPTLTTPCLYLSLYVAHSEPGYFTDLPHPTFVHLHLLFLVSGILFPILTIPVIFHNQLLPIPVSRKKKKATAERK